MFIFESANLAKSNQTSASINLKLKNWDEKKEKFIISLQPQQSLSRALQNVKRLLIKASQKERPT